MLLMVLLSVYAATNNFGIGEEYVRYSPDGSLFQVVQVENRNLRVYRVEGRRTRTHIRPGGERYAISDGKDHPTMWANWCPAARRRKAAGHCGEKRPDHTDG